MEDQREIHIVSLSDEDAFTSEVNRLLSEGWQIHSSSCGFVNSESYDFCNSYQAIMIKHDEIDRSKPLPFE